MISLTAPQSALLRYIAGYQASHGYSPSVSECGRALAKGKSDIHRLLCGLEERGAINRLRQRERAIDVLVPVAIPMAGNAPLYAVPIVPRTVMVFSGERV